MDILGVIRCYINMRYCFFIVWLSISGVVYAQLPNAAPQLAIADYAQQVADTDQVIIVDVRTPMEYKQGHVPGAINISFLGLGFNKKAAKLPRDKPLYIYCQTAHRSLFAAEKLFGLGFNEIYDLEGGFKNWENANLPTIGP